MKILRGADFVFDVSISAARRAAEVPCLTCDLEITFYSANYAEFYSQCSIQSWLLHPSCVFLPRNLQLAPIVNLSGTTLLDAFELLSFVNQGRFSGQSRIGGDVYPSILDKPDPSAFEQIGRKDSKKNDFSRFNGHKFCIP